MKAIKEKHTLVMRLDPLGQFSYFGCHDLERTPDLLGQR